MPLPLPLTIRQVYRRVVTLHLYACGQLPVCKAGTGRSSDRHGPSQPCAQGVAVHRVRCCFFGVGVRGRGSPVNLATSKAEAFDLANSTRARRRRNLQESGSSGKNRLFARPVGLSPPVRRGGKRRKPPEIQKNAPNAEACGGTASLPQIKGYGKYRRGGGRAKPYCRRARGAKEVYRADSAIGCGHPPAKQIQPPYDRAGNPAGTMRGFAASRVTRTALDGFAPDHLAAIPAGQNRIRPRPWCIMQLLII